MNMYIVNTKNKYRSFENNFSVVVCASAVIIKTLYVQEKTKNCCGFVFFLGHIAPIVFNKQVMAPSLSSLCDITQLILFKGILRL